MYNTKINQKGINTKADNTLSLVIIYIYIWLRDFRVLFFIIDNVEKINPFSNKKF